MRRSIPWGLLLAAVPWALIAFVALESHNSSFFADQFSFGRHPRLMLLFDSGRVALTFARHDYAYGYPPHSGGKWFRREQFVCGRARPENPPYTGGSSPPAAPMWGRDVVWIDQSYWDISFLIIPDWALLSILALWPLSYVGKRLGDRYLRRPLPAIRRCARCGYDLVYTAADSPCPECGLLAERSLIKHEHPDDCPPRWVRMITVGSLLLLIAYLLAAAWLALAVMLEEPPTSTRQTAALFALSLAVLAHATGNVLLSLDDRRRPFAWRAFLLCWSLRLLPLPPVVSAAVVVLMANDALAPSPALIAWIVPLALPLLVCPTLSFLRLRRLAVRLGRRRLAEHITIVAVGGALALMLVIGAALIASDQFRHADVFFVAFGVMPPALLALFSLWAMGLLGVVTHRFFCSAREAKARWRAADRAASYSGSLSLQGRGLG
jgi:hypothetical protein